MKKLFIILYALCAFVAVADTTVTNTLPPSVYTNVANGIAVRYDNYAVTNGYTETYSGRLITNTVIDSVVSSWSLSDGKFVLVTNKHDEIVGGSVTTRVYDVIWHRRPYYYGKTYTNITDTVRH